MRRGFKAQAERLAESTRQRLGLDPDEPIDIRELADDLEVDVRAADTLVSRKRLEALKRLQSDAFSAATFHLPDGRVVIVFNPLNELGRINSDLAHELAHLLLEHQVREIRQIAGQTFFTCDGTQETEANWLAGCLLLPRPLLLREARRGTTPADLAERYDVSLAMARFRLNTSGVLLQVRRAEAGRHGR